MSPLPFLIKLYQTANGPPFILCAYQLTANPTTTALRADPPAHPRPRRILSARRNRTRDRHAARPRGRPRRAHGAAHRRLKSAIRTAARTTAGHQQHIHAAVQQQDKTATAGERGEPEGGGSAEGARDAAAKRSAAVRRGAAGARGPAEGAGAEEAVGCDGGGVRWRAFECEMREDYGERIPTHGSIGIGRGEAYRERSYTG